MNRLEKIAEGMLRPINPYSTLILGVFTAFWGLWVITPGWSVFGSALLYSKMMEFAPEWAWGVWSLTSGLLLIICVFRGYYSNLSRALMFISWHWATVAGFMWWGDWHNTGGITYTTVAIYSIYCYFNIKMNYVKYGTDTPHFVD